MNNLTGILLINLGSPAAPTAKALRAYLSSFLSDPRVIEEQNLRWKLILHGIILPLRARSSAQKYAQIWTKSGSPLLLHLRNQTELLQKKLAQIYPKPPLVVYAVRHGKPSIDSAIELLQQQKARRLLLIPLFPQYAAASSASALDGVFQALQRQRYLPEIHSINSFHDHRSYIAALAASVRQHWQSHGRGNHLLISFHSLPHKSIALGDPYCQQCCDCAQLLADELELSSKDWQIAFQSRFGKKEWLKPYTHEVLQNLGAQKLAQLDIICPSFVADCLETLHEIVQEGKQQFQDAGGGKYSYIPCLNAMPEFIDALSQIIVDSRQF